MKKKGFTLIELIVVIAIIGVLAAILVPAMMGYVKKSKVTTNNTTAKSIYNAFNTTITDLDAQDGSIAQAAVGACTSTLSKSGFTFPHTIGTDTSGLALIGGKVYSYFKDVEEVDDFQISFEADHSPNAIGVKDGRYTGSYPRQMDPDNGAATGDAAAAIGYAGGTAASGGATGGATGGDAGAGNAGDTN